MPSKVLILAWKTIIHRLPTHDLLIRRGIISNTYERCCVLCFGVDESVDHLFCCCGVTQKVWSAILDWLGLGQIAVREVNEHFKAFGLCMKGRKLKRVKYIVWMASIWAIWQARNRVLFEGKPAKEASIINCVKQLSWGWFIARRGKRVTCSFVDWLNCPLGCLSLL